MTVRTADSVDRPIVPGLARPVDWLPDRDGIRVLDQTQLPDSEEYIELRSVDAAVEAIQSLRVRGAPLIGITAAMTLAAEARRFTTTNALDGTALTRAADTLEGARPTAVNLHWALERQRTILADHLARGDVAAAVADALADEAQRIWEEDAAMCRRMGEYGADLIPPGATVLTHCNTGALATGGIGTALAAVYVAHARGNSVRVVATETRPLRQGARLTAWELVRAGIPVTVIADSAAAGMMARGAIDLVITGADRIAANGDTANKIGTYALAVLASAHAIPFHVAAPRSTIDVAIPSGQGIPIEQRDGGEIAAAAGADVANPAFDVTPARLIVGIVTDAGVLRPPYDEAIAEIQ